MVKIGTHSYRVSTLGYLRTGIAAYRGTSAIVKELVQNADDASATWLEFEFQQERLVVRNSGVFSDDDFEKITVIAAGGKRENADQIGTWGTGFTSVFQLTDRPEIRSRSTALTLDPTNENYFAAEIEPQSGTEFRFPWRSSDTPLSRVLLSEPWTRTRIEEFLSTLRAESFRNLLFLRHLREIRVLDSRTGQPRLLYAVQRSALSEPARAGDCQSIDIRTTRNRGEEWKTSWHVLSRELSASYGLASGEHGHRKSSRVQVAFGETPPGTDGSGVLYNFLPTTIVTGFGFHINGDFYPTSDRSGIMVGSDYMGSWNGRLVAGIAELVADNLQEIRDRAGSPERFYRLLPIAPSPQAAFLGPIVDQVRKKARDCREPGDGWYVWSVRGKWTRTSFAQKPGDDRLAALTADGGESFPHVASAELTAPVQEYLGVRAFTWVNFAEKLKDALKPNTKPENAGCALVATRERLDQLVKELDREIGVDELSRGAHQRSPLADAVRGLPLALDVKGILRRLGDDEQCPALASNRQLRELVPAGRVNLLEPDFEASHRRFLGRFLRELSVGEVVRALRDAGAGWVGRPLEEADPAIGSWPRLGRLWTQIAQAAASESVAAADLRGAPILVDETGLVTTGGDGAPIIAPADALDLLAPLGYRVLHPELARRQELEPALRLAGVRVLGPVELVGHLRQWCTAEGPLSEAHPALAGRDRLVAWYAYLGRHLDALSPDDRDALRELPLVLTQSGRLAAAGAGGRSLSLPPEGSAGLDPALYETLELAEIVVDVDGLDPDAIRFLRLGLGIQPLTRTRLVRDHALQHYERVEPERRLRLLELIRDEAAGPYDHGFVQRLHEVPLIPCTDGVYRRPSEVYHPDEALKAVFPFGWPRPDIPRFDDQRGHWLRFFERLDLPRRPLPADLVAAAREIASADWKDTARRQQAVEILGLLDQQWEAHYQKLAGSLAPLRELRWLPAQNRSEWHRPADLVPATFAELAGSQVAVAQGRVPSRAFSQAIGMPTSIPATTVIAHLLKLGRDGSHQDPTAIYNHLVQPHLLKEAEGELPKLRHEPVIYHAGRKRWFTPDKTYLFDVSELLGNRRVSLPDQPAHRALFIKMGVRERTAPFSDAIDLLQEIAAETDSLAPISEQDVRNVVRAHKLLVGDLRDVNWSDRGLRQLDPLRRTRSVVDDAGRLCKPDQLFIHDVPDLKQRFPGQVIPQARVDVELAGEQERLLEELGVGRLSVRAKRVIQEARDPRPAPEFVARLRRLAPHLDRIASAGDGRAILNWAALEVRKVRTLAVQWELPLPGAASIRGPLQRVPACYDEGQRVLYLTNDGDWDVDLWPVTREFAAIIAPSRVHEVTAPLHEVFRYAHDGDFKPIEAYLDNAGFPSLAHRTHTDTTVTAEERATSVTRFDAAPPPALAAEPPPQTGEIKVIERAAPPARPEPHGRQPGLQAPLPAPSPAPVPAEPNPSSLAASAPAFDRATDPAPAPVVERTIETAEPIAPAAVTPTQFAPEPDEPAARSKRDERIPVFVGNDRPMTPANATDWNAIRQRFGPNLLETGGEEDAPITEGSLEVTGTEPTAEVFTHLSSLNVTTERAPAALRQPDEEVRSADTWLYGQGLASGALRLRGRLAALFKHDGRAVLVEVDTGEEFPLYLDPRNDRAYNQEALPEWFALQQIPAGARLTFARTSKGRYRLCAHRCAPREIEGLCLLEKEPSGPGYREIIATRITEWEVEEQIFRHETRLEDPEALAAQAIGKGSVFQILIELLAESEAPLSIEQLREAVHARRQVSAATVPWELQQSLCFVQMPDGRWRFEPNRLGAEYRRRQGLPDQVQLDPRAPVPNLDGRSSKDGQSLARRTMAPEEIAALLRQVNQSLTAWDGGPPPGSLEPLGRAVGELVDVYRRVERRDAERRRGERLAAERPAPARTEAERLSDALDLLRDEHGPNAIYVAEFGELLGELLQLWGSEANAPALVRQHVAAASPDAWTNVVRPALDGAVETLAGDGRFDAALDLLLFDVEASGRDRGADADRLAARAEAHTLATEAAAATDLNERIRLVDRALALDPEGALVREQARLVAPRAADQEAGDISLLIELGDIAGAFAVLEEARARLVARTRPAPGEFPQHRALDAAAERLVRLCLDATRVATGDRLTPTSLGLAVIRKHLPSMRRSHQDVRKIEALLLSKLHGEMESLGRSTEALLALLLSFRAATQVRTDKQERRALGTAIYPKLTDLAEQLTLWDLAINALREYQGAGGPANARSRQHYAEQKYFADREAVAERYRRAADLLRALPADDPFRRALGASAFDELARGETWERLLPRMG